MYRLLIVGYGEQKASHHLTTGGEFIDPQYQCVWVKSVPSTARVSPRRDHQSEVFVNSLHHAPGVHLRISTAEVLFWAAITAVILAPSFNYQPRSPPGESH
jgi:hypothetical protein